MSALAVGCSSPTDDGAAAGSSGLGMGGASVGPGGSGNTSGGSPSAGGANGGRGGSGNAGGSSATMGGAAGSPAAGGSAAGGTGGTGLTSALCPDGALFCEDFEDHALAQAPGSPWRASFNSGGTVNVDEAQAFSGSRAAHVSAPTGAAYRRAYIALDQGSGANIFPAAAQEMYGRAMMYLQVIPGSDAHWTFIQGEGLSANGSHNALYRFGGQHQNGAQLMANYETTMISTDCWDHSATLMPAATWACVEWRFVVASNEMQLWLDGTELTDIHVTGAGEGCGGDSLGGQWIAPPAFQTLYLGWEHYQTTANPIDLWLDDVVVSTERVGCPAD